MSRSRSGSPSLPSLPTYTIPSDFHHGAREESAELEEGGLLPSHAQQGSTHESPQAVVPTGTHVSIENGDSQEEWWSGLDNAAIKKRWLELGTPKCRVCGKQHQPPHSEELLEKARVGHEARTAKNLAARQQKEQRKQNQPVCDSLITSNTTSPRELLEEIKSRLAPTDEAHRMELQRQYQNLKKPPRLQNIITWLKNWDLFISEASNKDLAELQGQKPFTDFLYAVKMSSKMHKKIKRKKMLLLNNQTKSRKRTCQVLLQLAKGKLPCQMDYNNKDPAISLHCYQCNTKLQCNQELPEVTELQEQQRLLETSTPQTSLKEED
ncbi:Integrase catalytic core [Lasiodiplodia theobromae]|nr:Integrase catalytic core [Lasiodiplodia theobromae]